MVAKVVTVAFEGVEARRVDVEVQLVSGEVRFIIVGLGDKAVAESRERVWGAFAALGIALPARRIVVNLAPANLPKEIVDKLNAAMRKIGKMEAVVARANQLGTVLKDWSPAQMDSFAKGEVETWGKVIRDNNITFTE